MTDSSPTSATDEAPASGDKPAVTDGRYLYCVVDTTTAEQGPLSTSGIDDNPVYVIEYDTVGAVVHDCATVYDTDDPEQATQWLLTHQQVVDTASDVFGTPLPVRFDTILEGGDEGVEQWLQAHHRPIRRELASVAGTWEYRIHLFWDPAAFEAHIADQDYQLQELAKYQQQAEAERRVRLKKQSETRLQELKQERRTELTETVQQTVAPVVNEWTTQDTQTTLQTAPAAGDRECVTRLAVLADEGNETALSNLLDEIVDQEGVEIRFTGPWPPYTFVPDIGGG